MIWSTESALLLSKTNRILIDINETKNKLSSFMIDKHTYNDSFNAKHFRRQFNHRVAQNQNLLMPLKVVY